MLEYMMLEVVREFYNQTYSFEVAVYNINKLAVQVLKTLRHIQ
jgi:hypothetical protein